MFFLMSFLISVQSGNARPMQSFERDNLSTLERDGYTCTPMRPNAVGGSVRTCEKIDATK